MLKGIDMVVYQALKRVLGDARITAVLDDSEYVSHLLQREGNESLYQNTACVAATPSAPTLVPSCDRTSERWLDPDFLVTCKGRLQFDYMYDRERVTWLNHPPDEATSKELSIAYVVSLLTFAGE